MDLWSSNGLANRKASCKPSPLLRFVTPLGEQVTLRTYVGLHWRETRRSFQTSTLPVLGAGKDYKGRRVMARQLPPPPSGRKCSFVPLSTGFASLHPWLVSAARLPSSCSTSLFRASRLKGDAPWCFYSEKACTHTPERQGTDAMSWVAMLNPAAGDARRRYLFDGQQVGGFA